MKTNQRIRPATGLDLPEVLRLNQSALPHVSRLTTNGLRSLFDEAAWFHIAEINGECAGFLIALWSWTKYQSENFLWFAQRVSNFLYIDRICVSPRFQRRGVASQLYVSVERFAREGQIPLLTCEVNLEPENPPSLAFHDRQGFKEVDTQRTERGTKLVSLRLKHLGSSALTEDK